MEMIGELNTLNKGNISRAKVKQGNQMQYLTKFSFF